MAISQITGVVPAVPTPVSNSGEPDTDRLIEFCRKLFSDGANALNITGTTGEATSLSVSQRKKIIKAISDSDIPKPNIMFGTGAAAVADAVELSSFVAECGFNDILLLPPFYFKDPSFDGLAHYFHKIVQATDENNLNIYLYNFPALSGIAYSTPLIERLITEFGERIVGLKDSSGDMAYAKDVAAKYPAFRVFPSNEGTLLQSRDGVFAGCISATANLSVKLCVDAFSSGDEQALNSAIKTRAIIARGSLVPRIKATIAEELSDPAWANVLPPYVTLGKDDRAELFREITGVQNN